MSDWQDISTAPKDGTRVLTWDGDNILASVYEYYYPHGTTIRGFEQPGWVQWAGQSGVETIPTHWMPLPNAPGEPQ